MPSRPFYKRLALAALGMVLVCLLGAVGLGWAVRDEHRKWPVKILGKDRCAHLHAESIVALGTLFPADTDGDGVADSVERYMGHDPHNPRDHPWLDFRLDDPGFEYSFYYAIQPGERRRIHARARFVTGVGKFEYVYASTFAPGMRLQFDPEPPGMLSLPGGTPSSSPLLVPVAADGAMDFELAIRDDVVPTQTLKSYRVEASHPLSDSLVSALFFDVVWRQPPLSCNVEEIPFQFRDVIPMGHDLGDKAWWHSVLLAWQPAEPAGKYYIEACRDVSDDPHWFVVDVCPGDKRGCKTSYRFSDSRLPPRDRLKFRIIPTSPFLTKEPDEKDAPVSAYRLRDYVPKRLFDLTKEGILSCHIVPVPFIADSPESAKAILQTFVGTPLIRLSRRTAHQNLLFPEVTGLEPLVCNGFFVFQVRVGSGRLFVVLDRNQPQAGGIFYGD